MIPVEAVEAAADMIVQGDRGACECRRSIFDKHDVSPPCSTRRQATRTARAALEAAAPYIGARSAWHDAVSDAYVDGALSAEQANVMWAKNPYRSPA